MEEEIEKDKDAQKQNFLKKQILCKGIKKGFGGLKKSLSEGFTKLTGGSGLLGKFVRGTLLWTDFCNRKFF